MVPHRDPRSEDAFNRLVARPVVEFIAPAARVKSKTGGGPFVLVKFMSTPERVHATYIIYVYIIHAHMGFYYIVARAVRD